MQLDQATFWAFFLVFLRCSAMSLASPIFGSQAVPVRIRVGLATVISLALTFVVRPMIGDVPETVPGLVLSSLHELFIGILIGTFFQLVLQAIQMAGSMMDLQMGLSSSQTLNPVSGVSVTVIAQFKYMLGVVIFLSVGGHQTIVQAFVASYHLAPPSSMVSMAAVQLSLLDLVQGFSLMAVQMAMPIAAVSFIVDAALGLVNKAVPMVPVFLIGLPAKIILGIITLSVLLPAVASGVRSGVDQASEGLIQALQGGGNGR